MPFIVIILQKQAERIYFNPFKIESQYTRTWLINTPGSYYGWRVFCLTRKYEKKHFPC